MSARRPARLLAPLALVITAVALIAVLTSGGGETGTDEVDIPAATATATPAAESKGRRGKSRKTYVVKPGDTPSAIAAEHDLSVDQLLELNPDVDPQGLTPGQKLKLAP